MPFTEDQDMIRFGVMFFAGPVATFTNIRKAMKPDGRLALAVFRTPQENKGATAALAGPPHVAAQYAAGSRGAGPIRMGRCSTCAPHLGVCGFSRRFPDTARPSHAAGSTWRKRKRRALCVASAMSDDSPMALRATRTKATSIAGINVEKAKHVLQQLTNHQQFNSFVAGRQSVSSP